MLRQLAPAQKVAHQCTNRASSAFGQFITVGQLQRCRGQRQAGGPRMLEHPFQRLGAKAAFGLVVNPFKRQVITRLGNHAQIGEGVADFRPLVKTKTPDDAVIQPDLDETVFKFAGLILRPHQYGHLIQRGTFAFQPLCFLAHAARFFRRVPHADDADFVAAFKLRPQRFADAFAIGIDKPRCGRQNMRRGAVILFQLDHFGAGKILLELENIGDFRAPPGIDRLVIIAHYADVLARLCQQAQPQILDLIGVLIFIDQNIFEPVLIHLQNFRIAPQYVEHMQQQIAKIACVERFQTFLIQGVKFLSAAIGVGFIFNGIEIGGVQSAVFPPVNQSGQLARRPAFFIQILIPNELFQQS